MILVQCFEVVGYLKRMFCSKAWQLPLTIGGGLCSFVLSEDDHVSL